MYINQNQFLQSACIEQQPMALRSRQDSHSSFIIRKKQSRGKFSLDNYSSQKINPIVINTQISLSTKKNDLTNALKLGTKAQSKIEMFKHVIFDFGRQKSLGAKKNPLLSLQKNTQKQNNNKYNQNQNTTIFLENISTDSVDCLNLENSYSTAVNQNNLLKKNRFSENLRIQQQQNIRNLLLYQNMNYKSETQIPHKIEISTQTETTQKNQIERQSYQQYLKFKLTKKQSFKKLQNLFKFIQTLTQAQEENFTNCIQKIKQMFGNQVLDERQKRVDELMEEIPSAFKNFNNCYKKIFKQQKHIINQVLSKEQSQLHYSNDLIKQIEKNIQCMFCQKQFFKQKVQMKQIKKILQQVRIKQEANFQKKYSLLSNKIYQSDDNCEYLQQIFNEWQRKIIQQQTLIKNCVLNISELPQICMTIFGMEDNGNLHQSTNLQIQKYGVRLNKLPHISDFFIKPDHQNVKQIDQTFSKCCDIKCMNCVYMRSKMKYIERKNIELQPILRVLMQLINWQDQKIYNHSNFAERVTDKCFNRNSQSNIARY